MFGRVALAGLVALVVLVTAGCSADDPDGDPKAEASGQGSPEDPAAETPLVDRCGSAIADPSLLREATITGAEGQDLELRAGVFSAGPSDTALVLLHQIGGAGLCGWGRFATAAARAGVTSVAVDMCGYRDSFCADVYLTDPAAQVTAAAAWAREELDVRRVVVVGASMGGSQAVRAVAGGAPVDAWVDVSGPSSWDDVPLLSVADKIRQPGLVIHSEDDGFGQYRKAQQLAERAGAEFLRAPPGHGWDLVTNLEGELSRVGTRVLRFAESDPTGN